MTNRVLAAIALLFFCCLIGQAETSIYVASSACDSTASCVQPEPVVSVFISEDSPFVVAYSVTLKTTAGEYVRFVKRTGATTKADFSLSSGESRLSLSVTALHADVTKKVEF